MSSILDILTESNYTFANCRILKYDKTNPIFGPYYLAHLYELAKSSGRHNDGLGILPLTFCGFQDLSYDAVHAYLVTRAILVWAVNYDDATGTFDTAGFAFPTAITPGLNIPAEERACMAGYGCFRPYWGTPEAETLGMLTLAFMFQEWHLVAVQGQRLPWNRLTAKFMEKYGARDIGRMPKFMVQEGHLVDSVFSCLMRSDFERYVEKFFLGISDAPTIIRSTT